MRKKAINLRKRLNYFYCILAYKNERNSNLVSQNIQKFTENIE